jgi:hypothetical protein
MKGGDKLLGMLNRYGRTVVQKGKNHSGWTKSFREQALFEGISRNLNILLDLQMFLPIITLYKQ